MRRRSSRKSWSQFEKDYKNRVRFFRAFRKMDELDMKMSSTSTVFFSMLAVVIAIIGVQSGIFLYLVNNKDEPSQSSKTTSVQYELEKFLKYVMEEELDSPSDSQLIPRSYYDSFVVDPLSTEFTNTSSKRP